MSDCCNSCTALDDPAIHSCLDRRIIPSSEATPLMLAKHPNAGVQLSLDQELEARRIDSQVEQPTEPMEVAELLKLLRTSSGNGLLPWCPLVVLWFLQWPLHTKRLRT